MRINNHKNLYFQSSMLSIIAAISGSFLFLCLYLTTLWTLGMLSGIGFISQDVLFDRQGYLGFFFLVYWPIGYILTFLVSVIPATLAGLSNAWLLQVLAKSNALTSLRGIVIGILVGNIFSLIPIYIGVIFITQFVFDTFSGKLPSQAFLEIALSGLLTSGIVGGWHGSKVANYLNLSS